MTSRRHGRNSIPVAVRRNSRPKLLRSERESSPGRRGSASVISQTFRRRCPRFVGFTNSAGFSVDLQFILRGPPSDTVPRSPWLVVPPTFSLYYAIYIHLTRLFVEFPISRDTRLLPDFGSTLSRRSGRRFAFSLTKGTVSARAKPTVVGEEVRLGRSRGRREEPIQ